MPSGELVAKPSYLDGFLFLREIFEFYYANCFWVKGGELSFLNEYFMIKERIMKKLLLILAFFMITAFITSCVPEKSQGVLPCCKDQYDLLLGQYPDYPQAFIGACVAYYQTGKTSAFTGLCGNEIFRASLERPEVTTREECIQYIKNYSEP